MTEAQQIMAWYDMPDQQTQQLIEDRLSQLGKRIHHRGLRHDVEGHELRFGRVHIVACLKDFEQQLRNEGVDNQGVLTSLLDEGTMANIVQTYLCDELRAWLTGRHEVFGIPQ